MEIEKESFQRAQSGANPSGGTALQFQRVCCGLQLQAWIQNEPQPQVLSLVKTIESVP